MKRTTNI